MLSDVNNCRGLIVTGEFICAMEDASVIEYRAVEDVPFDQPFQRRLFTADSSNGFRRRMKPRDHRIALKLDTHVPGLNQT